MNSRILNNALFWADNKVRGPVAAAAVSTMSLRIANVLLGVAATVVLGRTLGPAGFGVFAIGLASSALVSGPVQLALNHHIVNKTAAYLSESAWPLLNGVRQYTLLATCGLAIVLGAVVAAIGPAVKEPMTIAALIGVGIAPLIIASSFAGALLRGLGKVAEAYIPQFAVMQLLHLIIVSALALTGLLTATTALISYGAAWLVSAALSWALALRTWPAPSKGVQATMLAREWTRSTGYIFIGGLSGVLFGRIETFALAEFSTAAEVGVYALAFRFAQFVTFPAFALASGLAPEVSRLVASHDAQRARNKTVAATRLATALALAGGVALYIACSYIFPFINPEFSAAAPILAILAIGYIAHTAAGFPMVFIVAFELEKRAAMSGFLAAVGGACLVPLLTVFFGAVGAASATAIAVALTGFVRWRVVHNNERIRCDIFSRRERPPR